MVAKTVPVTVQNFKPESPNFSLSRKFFYQCDRRPIRLFFVFYVSIIISTLVAKRRANEVEKLATFDIA